MIATLKVLALLCLFSLLYILVIPFFARTSLLMRFLPEEIGLAAKDHPDPPLWKRLIGYVLTLGMAGLFLGALAYTGADGIGKGAGFLGLYGRYLLLLYGYKLFDILVQDQYIVITKKYFVRFYPETRDCRSWNDRGFNTKNQLVRLAAFPFVCAGLASAAWWIGG